MSFGEEVLENTSLEEEVLDWTQNVEEVEMDEDGNADKSAESEIKTSEEVGAEVVDMSDASDDVIKTSTPTREPRGTKRRNSGFDSSIMSSVRNLTLWKNNLHPTVHSL